MLLLTEKYNNHYNKMINIQRDRANTIIPRLVLSFRGMGWNVGSAEFELSDALDWFTLNQADIP